MRMGGNTTIGYPPSGCGHDKNERKIIWKEHMNKEEQKKIFGRFGVEEETSYGIVGEVPGHAGSYCG